jgi:hypothetical protein
MSRPGGLPNLDGLPAEVAPSLPGVSTALARLAAADARLRRETGKSLEQTDASRLSPVERALLDSGSIGADDRVQVYVESASMHDALAAVTSAGGVIERARDDIIQARVSLRALGQLGTAPGVLLVREPDRALLEQGSETTEGDAVLKAFDVREAYGVDGTGVRVGVISNGLEGLDDAQALGDLPEVNSTTCDVIDSAPPGEPADPTDAGAGAEGTAMLEIVHDLAPGAELWFGYFGFALGGTSLDFMAAVDCLAEHVDVVIDDITFVNAGPYDGTSDVSQNAVAELTDAANPIRGYFNPAGNYALQHYQQTFASSGFSAGVPARDLHEWSATGATTDADFGLFCSANPADGFCGDMVVLQPGGSVVVGLQWNDPWGSSANDYDIFVIDTSSVSPTIITLSANVQDGNDNPAELGVWVNTTLADQYLAILIGRRAGAARVLDQFTICTGCYALGDPLALHNFNTASSSILNNSDAAAPVMTLGAIDALDPGNDDIQEYSSQGPTNDGRIKPDAAAVDGVSVTGSGGFPSTFFGTSAAAPHAGGVAALILSCAPSLLSVNGGDASAERTILRNALLGSAIDLGSAGTDNVFGAGRIDALAAATAAGCSTDGDGDGVLNAVDNCPTIPNPDQTNTDNQPLVTAGFPNDTTIPNGDDLGDACDPDDDNDGILDVDEAAGCNGSGPLDPKLADTDGDRSLDWAECLLGSNPADPLSKPNPDPPNDTDNDGLPDAVEILIGSDPNVVDSDGDGVNDNIEFRGYNTLPAVLDTDGDGCNDDQEIASVNTDTVVNVLDLFLVASGFGMTNRPAHDLNKDGTITVLDLALQAAQTTSVAC